jgi:predicted permease
MDGLSVQVVGVMPPVSLPIGGSTLALPGPDVPVFWRPLDYELDWVSDIVAHVMAGVARLKPETTLVQAQEEVSAVAAGLIAEDRAPEGQGIFVRPFKEEVVGDVSRNLTILLAAVSLLLLLACGNVANLLLARAKDRERELSVRAAIGAGRGRLVRQTLTETTLLSVAGGALGLAIARWGSLALVSRLPSNLPRQNEIGVDGTVLLFALGAVLLASVLAALIPTVRLSGRDSLGGLKAAGRGGTHGKDRNRANRAIVVAQLSMATVLLFGAGLLFRSLRTLEGVDPGFRKEGVLTAQLMLPEDRYASPGNVLSLFDQLRERIRGLPGVSEVAVSMDHPLQTTWWNGFGLLDRPAPDPDESPTAIFRPVSDGYFSAFSIPIREGRGFDSGDRFDGHPVMVVNQAFVDTYYQGESPLGDRIEFVVGRFIWGEEAPTIFEVVGVAGDVRFNGLREPSEPAFHIPMHQFPYRALKLVVRGTGTLDNLAGLVQSEVWAVDPDLPVTGVRTMEQIFDAAVAQDRFNVILLEVFALAALVLAAAGIYGVLNYAVSQRRAEIGIRMALGAQASSVLRMVVREAVIMGGAGLALGIGLALVLSRFLGSLLFQVPGHDALVVAVTSSVLGLVALASGLVPAFRAAGTDPMEALRAE